MDSSKKADAVYAAMPHSIRLTSGHATAGVIVQTAIHLDALELGADDVRDVAEHVAALCREDIRKAQVEYCREILGARGDEVGPARLVDSVQHGRGLLCLLAVGNGRYFVATWFSHGVWVVGKRGMAVKGVPGLDPDLLAVERFRPERSILGRVAAYGAFCERSLELGRLEKTHPS